MPHSFQYSNAIYRTADASVVLTLLQEYYRFSSLLDVGCGTGTWLSIAKNQFGLVDIQGVDASKYDESQFHIPAVNYLQQDLSVPLQLDRTYDLVICLEVAEHLPETVAGALVKSLVSHGAVVLFSAAIPGQGGQNHINERWQSYWQQLFAAEGYLAIDVIRPYIWHHPVVLPWYKQNTLLYVKDNHPLAQHYTASMNVDLVHPEIFGYKLNMINELAALKQKTVFRPSLFFALKALAKSILVTPFRK